LQEEEPQVAGWRSSSETREIQNEEDMKEAIEIYHKSVPALFIAMCFILVKRLAEKRRPALGDSSDIAWTLIMMSIGALAVYLPQTRKGRQQHLVLCQSSYTYLTFILGVSRKTEKPFRCIAFMTAKTLSRSSNTCKTNLPRTPPTFLSRTTDFTS
jgi:hypothetical protein